MGMWGLKIDENDEFLDIKEDFFFKFSCGLPVTKINEQIIEEQTKTGLEGGDFHNVYFALAYCGWKVGSVAPEILSEVERIIAQKENLDYLREMGLTDESELKQRDKILNRFLAKIKSVNPTPKAQKVRKFFVPYLQSGDVFVAKKGKQYHPGVVLWTNDVIHCHNPQVYKSCYDLLIAFSDLTLSAIPTVDEIINSDVFYVSWHTFEDIPPKSKIAVIGNIRSQVYDEEDYRNDFGANITTTNFYVNSSRFGSKDTFFKGLTSVTSNATLKEIKGKLIKDLFKIKSDDFSNSAEQKGFSIADLPDDEVIDAALTFVDKYDVFGGRDAFSNAPKPCKNVLAVFMLDAQVNNGGFNQFYHNGYLEYDVDYVEAFTEIGLLEQAAIVKEAQETYYQVKDTLPTRGCSIEEFSASYEDDPFEKYDDAYYEFDEKQRDVIVIAYIRKNISFFSE